MEDGAEAESGTLDDTCSYKYRIAVTHNSTKMAKTANPFCIKDSPLSCEKDDIISFFFRSIVP